jgi:hypothetical protein
MWRRLLGPLCAYPRVQLFFEKIKIEKFFENTAKHQYLKPGYVRGATFSIKPYFITFDVYETPEGRGKVFIVDNLDEDAERLIAEWYNQHHTCPKKYEGWCEKRYEHLCNRTNCPEIKRRDKNAR